MGAGGVARVILRERRHRRVRIGSIPVAEVVDVVRDMLEGNPELDQCACPSPSSRRRRIRCGFRAAPRAEDKSRSKLDAGHGHVQIAEAAAQFRLIEAIRLAVRVEAVAEGVHPAAVRITDVQVAFPFRTATESSPLPVIPAPVVEERPVWMPFGDFQRRKLKLALKVLRSLR